MEKFSFLIIQCEAKAAWAYEKSTRKGIRTLSDSLNIQKPTMMAVNASSSSTASSSAVRALALELKSLQEDPLEGIRSRLVNEDNLFEWEVALFGPPETLYEGGYFKVRELLVKMTKSPFPWLHLFSNGNPCWPFRI